MDEKEKKFRKTKIIATIGPSSVNKIEELIEAGVNVFRLNFSHSNHKDHAQAINKINTARKKLKKWVGILADLQGPKIRVGKVKQEIKNGKSIDIPLKLEEGEDLIITTDDIIGEGNCISTYYTTLPQEVKAGQRIFFDDGNICVSVKEIIGNNVHTIIETTGLLYSNKGINLPDTSINSPALTKKDITDLNFLLSLDDDGVDCIALSFVRNPQDIEDAKKIMKEHNKFLPIIAKIERPEGIDNINQIIKNADGIMVARGDLGVEVAPESVPHHQKMIIKKCNFAGKPVIVATQMLDSVIKNPRSTRAEAADCANAVLDGASALMLSGETASGKYPLEAVRIMDRIISYTEAEPTFNSYPLTAFETKNDVEAITLATVKLANNYKDSKAIFCITRSGKTAKETARYRPRVPIIALVPEATFQVRFLALYWGVYITVLDSLKENHTKIINIEEQINHFQYLEENDLVIITGGLPFLKNTETNIVKIHRIKK